MHYFDVAKLSEIERHALLFGILLGDGCLSYYTSGNKESYTICVTGNLVDDIEFFEFVLLPLVNSIVGRFPIIKKRLKYGACEIQFKSKTLFLYLESLGFNRGKKQDIEIPTIFNGELMKLVIAGILATDGSFTIVNNNGTVYPRIFLTASLPSAFKQVYDYLISKNISVGYYSAKRKSFGQHDFQRTKENYVVSINGKSNISVFCDLVPFINPKQENKYAYFVQNGAGENRTPDLGLMRAAP